MRYTFAPVKTRREVKTFCSKCGKKLIRVLSRQCYNNGFHNVAATIEKYRNDLDKEQRRLEKKGTLCSACGVQ